MRRLAIAFSMTVLMTAPVAGFAATTNWTGANSTDWVDPGNWDSGVPGGADDAHVSAGAGHDALISAPGAVASTLTVGEAVGAGNLTINGGTLTSGVNAIGAFDPSAVGHVTVTGAGSVWNSTGFLTVGHVSGTGTVDVLNGAHLNSSNTYVGLLSGTGAVNVDGAGSVWTEAVNIYVGASDGSGAINITNGGQIHSLNGVLGNDGFSFGSVTIDGAGSDWTVGDSFFTGFTGNGQGSVLLTNGGTLHATNSFFIGDDNAATGDVTVTDANSLLSATTLSLRGGSLTVADGGTVTVSNLDITTASTINIGNGGASGTLHIGSGVINSVSAGASALNFNFNDIADYAFTYDVTGNIDTHVQQGSVVMTGTTNNNSVNIDAGKLTQDGGTMTTNALTGGLSGNEEFDIINAAVVTVNGDIDLGNFGSQTILNVTGAGAELHSTGQLNFGGSTFPTSQLNITGGALVSVDALDLSSAGGESLTTIDGGSTLDIANVFYVGDIQRADVNVSGGADITSGLSYIGFGGNNSTVSLDGAGTTWTVAADVWMGYYSNNGTLNLSNGAAMTADSILLGVAGTAIINIGADPVDPAAAPGTLNLTVGGIAPSGGGSGTINFNHTSANYTFDPDVSGDIHVNNYAGVTRLTGADSYTNTTHVFGGTLIAASALNSATTVDAGALFGGAGTQQALANSGTIAPSAGTPGGHGVMTVNGGYTGVAGSHLLINTTLGDSASATDKLVIDTLNATGTTSVTVNNTGGLGARTTGDGIKIVAATGGATIADGTFALAGGNVTAGSYTYGLFQGDAANLTPDDYFLRTLGFRDSIGSEGASVGIAAAYVDNMMSMMTSGREDLGQDVDVLDKLKLGFGGGLGDLALAEGMWVRAFGGQAKVENDDAASTEYDGSFEGMQAGKDIYRNVGEDGSKDLIGLYAAFGTASADLRANGNNAGDADMTAISAGVYATHYTSRGVYVSAAVQYNRIDGLKVSPNNGNALDTQGNGGAVSIEAGMPIKVGKRVIIEPQAQAIYQALKFNDANDGVADVSFKTLSTATGRVGTRFKYVGETESGLVVEPWTQINVWHTIETDSELTFDGTDTFTSPVGGTKGGVQLGLTIGRGTAEETAWNLYLNAGYQFSIAGSDLSAWNAGLGVRFNW